MESTNIDVTFSLSKLTEGDYSEFYQALAWKLLQIKLEPLLDEAQLHHPLNVEIEDDILTVSFTPDTLSP